MKNALKVPLLIVFAGLLSPFIIVMAVVQVALQPKDRTP